jgi:hypothetical protein
VPKTTRSTFFPSPIRWQRRTWLFGCTAIVQPTKAAGGIRTRTKSHLLRACFRSDHRETRSSANTSPYSVDGRSFSIGIGNGKISSYASPTRYTDIQWRGPSDAAGDNSRIASFLAGGVMRHQRLLLLSTLALGLCLVLLGVWGRHGCSSSRFINRVPEPLSGVLQSMGDALGYWDEECVRVVAPRPPFEPPPLPIDPDQLPPPFPSSPDRGWTTVEEGAFIYRPRLYFDRSERWRPLDVQALLAETKPDGSPRHQLCGVAIVNTRSKVICRPVRGIGRLPAVSEQLKAARATGFGLNLAGKRAGQYRSSNRSCRSQPAGANVLLSDCESGSTSRIYYHYTRRETPFGVIHVFDYWWYFRFNDARLSSGCRLYSLLCVDHEGDWEGVRVIAGDGSGVFGVDFSQHEWAPFRYLGPDLFQLHERFLPKYDAGLSPADTHAAVYIASGTHASYAFPCTAKCLQGKRRVQAGRPVVFPDGPHGGQVDWPANDDEVCRQTACVQALLKAEEKESLALDILWGWREGGEGAGPKTPTHQLRFERTAAKTSDGFPPAEGIPPVGQPKARR